MDAPGKKIRGDTPHAGSQAGVADLERRRSGADELALALTPAQVDYGTVLVGNLGKEADPQPQGPDVFLSHGEDKNLSYAGNVRFAGEEEGLIDRFQAACDRADMLSVYFQRKASDQIGRYLRFQRLEPGLGKLHLTDGQLHRLIESRDADIHSPDHLPGENSDFRRADFLIVRPNVRRARGEKDREAGWPTHQEQSSIAAVHRVRQDARDFILPFDSERRHIAEVRNRRFTPLIAEAICV